MNAWSLFIILVRDLKSKVKVRKRKSMNAWSLSLRARNTWFVITLRLRFQNKYCLGQY
jgi:hypothetical protein